uniref:DUF2807 domain-containing protein n=1 Tax=Strongyloides papillosus TaxID=174720 RepID=A0A0N5CHN1_STREA
MSLKILFLLIIFVAIFVIIKGSVARGSATVGETFNFDFGNDIKSVHINNNGLKEILHVGMVGSHGNVKLSSEGVLTISPVTENDFGTYEGKSNHVVIDGNVRVAPPTLILEKKGK